MTTIDMIDWNKIQPVIDSMKNKSDDNEPSRTVQDQIRIHLQNIEELVDYGWPYQEVGFDHEPIGIPLELAKIITSIFEFCAYANIDLPESLEMAKSV